MELDTPGTLHKAMAAADIFFAPCREGIGIVSLRAMAVGLPVVGTSHRVDGELLLGGCAELIEPGSEKEEVERYASVLEELVGAPRRRRERGGRARQYVLSKLGPDRLNQSLVEVIHQIRSTPRFEVALPSPDQAFVRAVECCRALDASEGARLRSDELEEQIRERDRTLRELRVRSEQLAEAKTWLEDQRSVMERTVAKLEQAIADQKTWIGRLEESQNWHDEQRTEWIAVAEQREARVNELLVQLEAQEQEAALRDDRFRHASDLVQERAHRIDELILERDALKQRLASQVEFLESPDESANSSGHGS